MNLQVIRSIKGKAEYILLPMHLYHALREEITEKLDGSLQDEYVPFDPADYVDNPVALARIKACMTQTQLAQRMKVTQAYISKLERQKKVTAKTLHRVKLAL